VTEKITCFRPGGRVRRIFIHSHYVYLGCGRDLYVLDIFDSFIKQSSVYRLPDDILGIFVDKKGGHNYIYIGNEDAGLQVLQMYH